MAAQVAGWVGTVLILVAYFLSMFELIQVGTIYQLLNFVGGIGLVWLGLSTGAYPVVCLNGIWALIALASIIRDKAK